MVDWSYIAGIIDGEGNFSLNRHKNSTSRGWHFQPQLAVSNTNYELIWWLKETTGLGSCYTKDYKKRNKNHSLPRVWVIYNINDITKVINRIEDVLIIKHTQAKLLKEFCRERINQLVNWEPKRDKKGRFICQEIKYTSRQYKIFEELKRLNHR